MEFRHLRYFCTVAEEGSFTRAAGRLHVSQSGVSGQIRDLEAELGVLLLRRERRKVTLTAAGMVFLTQARELLSKLDDAVAMVELVSKGRAGRLSIGLCGPATAPFLPRFIREFRRENAEVHLTLKDIEPAHQPAALAAGEIDVGFTRAVPPEFRATLSSEVLYREPLMAVLPRKHPLEQQEKVSLMSLSAEPFVLFARENAPELFDLILSRCRKAKFAPRVVDSPRQWQSVLTLVEAGEGIAIVPASVRHLRNPGLIFKPVQDRGCWIDVVMAWREGAPDAARDAFLELLRCRREEIEKAMRVA